MQCKNKIDLGPRAVPCGQCMACRIGKRSEWASRIEQECATTPYRSWFITLTYSEEHLPKTIEGLATLRLKDVQNFIKRTRKHSPIRYFAIGEYGDITQRPHYHLAVFPQSDAQVSAYTRSWKFGHTSVGELLPTRCSYLARYTVKKLNAAATDKLDGREPERSIQSRKPALAHTMANKIAATYETKEGASRLAARGDIEKSIRIGGKIRPIGKYGIAKIREHLGIPKNFAERKDANEHLEEYFPLEYDIEEDNITFIEQQAKLKRGQTKERLRTQTVNV